MGLNATCVECHQPANGRHIWDCCGDYEDVEYSYSSGCGRIVHNDCLNPYDQERMAIWQCDTCRDAYEGGDSSDEDDYLNDAVRDRHYDSEN